MRTRAVALATSAYTLPQPPAPCGGDGVWHPAPCESQREESDRFCVFACVPVNVCDPHTRGCFCIYSRLYIMYDIQFTQPDTFFVRMASVLLLPTATRKRFGEQQKAFRFVSNLCSCSAQTFLCQTNDICAECTFIVFDRSRIEPAAPAGKSHCSASLSQYGGAGTSLVSGYCGS